MVSGCGIVFDLGAFSRSVAAEVLGRGEYAADIPEVRPPGEIRQSKSAEASQVDSCIQPAGKVLDINDFAVNITLGVGQTYQFFLDRSGSAAAGRDTSVPFVHASTAQIPILKVHLGTTRRIEAGA